VIGVILNHTDILAKEDLEYSRAETYRVLRRNILFSADIKKLSTIIFVSACAGDGKSITILNLATVFAEAGQRVLVVDSDLRHPALHRLLHVANDIGLTNYLLNENTLEEVTRTVGSPAFNFISSGKLPATPISVLSSAKMKKMVAELKQQYDFVFFDSPPILDVNDASVLAGEMDIVILNMQYSPDSEPIQLHATRVMEEFGHPFFGIVLDHIEICS
jgi:capsular exopolysaccharide synthesis family protein